jgi:extradiol dioxygenase family protein
MSRAGSKRDAELHLDLLGAPHVERLRQKPVSRGDGDGGDGMVTGTMVGVIANLALWFALHMRFRNATEVSFGFATFASGWRRCAGASTW